MLRIVTAALVATALMAGSALADDIVGNWKTDSGETAAISGGGTFSIILKTGKHAGKRIGTFSASGGGKYSGKITDPADDKTYTGKATLAGNNLTMKGCVLAGLICQTQNWKRM